MTSSNMKDHRAEQVATPPQAQNSLPSVVERDQQGQILGKAAFWCPRHVEVSAVLGQVPFLFWLAEVTGPRLIVQMGLDDGIGYLAFCQAAERLNEGTICLALDTRAPALTPALQAEHDTHYLDFSQIISDEKAMAGLPKGIDLLVLGEPLEQNALDLLRDDILPRLSESAVVLVMNPDAVLSDQTVWRGVTGNDHPRMSMGPVVTGGAAVDVILYGAKQPDRLRRLVGQQPGQSSWLTMRQAFNRLGQGIVATRQNRDLSRDKDAWQARLKRTEAEIKALTIEVEEAVASERVQHQRQAEMAARIHDLQHAVSQAEEARNAAQIERDGLAAQLAEMQCALDHARAEHDTRIEDIVALTATYENNREQIERRTEAQLVEANKRVADLQRNLAKVSAHRDALLGSTSWKITSPLRKVTSVVRGY